MNVNSDPIFLKIPGLPGFQTFVTFMPDGNEQHAISSPENIGSQLNKFNIVFTLSRPDQALVPAPKVHFASQLKGDSYMRIDTVKTYHLGREDLPAPFIVKAHPNDEGNLGKIEFEALEAETLAVAIINAFRMLVPMLNTISTNLDIPFHIYQIDITDLRTNARWTSAVVPYFPIPSSVADLTQGWNSADFQFFASLYREALSSNSLNYQFLCLYKITEGIEERRKVIIRKAKKSGSVSFPSETIPTVEDEQIVWLNSIFPIQPWDQRTLNIIFRQEFIGRTLEDILENTLKCLRNLIAHAITGSWKSNSSRLATDDPVHVARLNEVLPMTKCIARRLLKMDFPKEMLRNN